MHSDSYQDAIDGRRGKWISEEWHLYNADQHLNLELIRSNEILAKDGFLYTTARDLGDHKIQRDGCCIILVHCCTRLSVGQTREGGYPLYARVFSLSSCHNRI